MAPTHLHDHTAPLQAGGLEPAGEAPDPGERCLTTRGDPRLKGGVGSGRTLSRSLEGGQETVSLTGSYFVFRSC